jgi:hypothetical protein
VAGKKTPHAPINGGVRRIDNRRVDYIVSALDSTLFTPRTLRAS